MQITSNILTPDTLRMLEAIAQAGSFAGAARQLGLVPSALTYRVRQIEDALDVLLFDRSARQAVPTEAGAELLREGARLLQEIDAVARRVQRVATGWESQFTIAADGIVSRTTLLELVEAFFALQPPTRVKIRDEILSGTLDALTSGQADIAIGVVGDTGGTPDIQAKPLGVVPFIYAVAPHHPLAGAAEPISDDILRQHRAIAVADSVQRGGGITVGLLHGQDVMTVPSMTTKVHAQLRGLGGGFLPEPAVRPYVQAGRLVAKRVDRPPRNITLSYAWRTSSRTPGRALQWWLSQLQSPATRAALLEWPQGT